MERRLFDLGLIMIAFDWIVTGLGNALHYGLSEFRGRSEIVVWSLGGCASGFVLLMSRSILGRALFGRSTNDATRPRDHLLPTALGIYGAWLLFPALPELTSFSVEAAVWSTMGLVIVVVAGRHVRRLPPGPAILVSAPEVARVLITLWGVTLVFRGIFGVPFYLLSPSALGGGRAVLVALGWLILGGVLAVKRRSVVHALLGDLGRVPSPFPPLAVLWGTALALIGLWLLMSAVPGFFEWILVENPPDHMNPHAGGRPRESETLAWSKTLLALVLVFEGLRLGRYWSADTGRSPA